MSTISADGDSDTIYIRMNGATVEKQINTGGWSAVSAWPVTIVNSGTNALKVLFTTDITLSGVNHYFICGSPAIQFGSDSLKTDGTRPIITINGVTDYPGLVSCGDGTISGYNDNRIINLQIDASGSTLKDDGGWFGQRAFSTNATGNSFVNCYATGDISQNSGGIVGRYAAYNGGNISLSGCLSSGSIALGGGGIVGGSAGSVGSGIISIEGCMSSGAIGDGGGGIIGAASDLSSLIISYCYSTGTIGLGSGGIIGANCGIAYSCYYCYSTGAIGNNGGGIFGESANVNSVASNCFSTGAIGTNAGGIFGNLASGVLPNNCYSSGAGSIGGIIAGSATDGATNYSEANNSGSGWSSTNANTALTGTPSASAVGTTWIQTASNTAYELRTMGYTPYTADIWVAGAFVVTFAFSVTAGAATAAAIVAGNTFSILAINNTTPSTYPTITINASTGALLTSTSTPNGSYTIILRNAFNPYAITEVTLTVSGSVPPTPTPTTISTCCSTTFSIDEPTYNVIYDIKIGNRIIVERETNPQKQFYSYSDYMKWKMALANKN